MGSAGRYALYHFKKTLVRFAVMMIYALVTINYGIHNDYYVSGEVTHSFSLGLYGVNFILLTIIAVILEFAPFKNRRNLDSWFSFPISRTALAAVHAINGAVQVWAVHTISFIWGIVKVMPYASECDLNFSAMWKMYFLVLFTGLVLYGFLMFPFILGNNIPDGILLGIGYVWIPILWITFFISGFAIKDTSEYVLGLPLICGSLASRCSDEFYYRPNPYNISFLRPKPLATNDYVTIAVWIGIGIALTVLAFVLFNRKKTEEIGGHSDSIFAYKTCIPLFMLPIILLVGGKIGIGILYGIATFLLYVIYRRSAKLKIPDIIVIAVILVLGNIPVSIVGELSSHFGGYSF